MNLSSCRQSQNRRTGARNQPEIGLKLVLRRLFSRCARCRKFITRSIPRYMAQASAPSPHPLEDHRPDLPHDPQVSCR